MLSKAMQKMFHVIKRSSDFFFSDEDDTYNSDISINDSSSDNSDDISDSIAIERTKVHKLKNKSGLIKSNARSRNISHNGRGAARNKQSGLRQPLSKKKSKQFHKIQNRTNLQSFSNYHKSNRSNANFFKSYNIVEDYSDSDNNADDNSFDSSEGRLIIDEDDFEDSEDAVILNAVGLKKIDQNKEKDDDDNSHCSFHTSPLKVIDLCGPFPKVKSNSKNATTSKNVNLGEKKKDVQEKVANDSIVLTTFANKDKRLNEEEEEVQKEPKNKKMKKLQLKNNSPKTKNTCDSDCINSKASDEVANASEKNVPMSVFLCEGTSSVLDQDSDGVECIPSRNDSSLGLGDSRTGKKSRNSTKELLLMKTKDIIKLVEREDHPLHDFVGIITEKNIENLPRRQRKVILHILSKLIDEAAAKESENTSVQRK